MALYALCLAQVRTKLNTTIKFTPTKLYLREASTVPLNHKQLDPLLGTRGLEAQCIKDVLSEVRQ